MLKSQHLLLLWATLQLLLLALLQEAFAWWIIAIYALLILYSATAVLQKKASASLKLANIIAALLTVALLLNMRQAGVLHFMLQILLLSAILRLFALRHLHEARQLVWVQYFLIASCFILHQQMLVAFAIVVLFGANCYSHYKLFAPAAARLDLVLSGRAVLIILPLWLGMFLLFPRLPPFWQIPNAKIASTGLSDTLDPGSIEKLVQDDRLAFRAEFSGALPERQQLYWRSYLYEDFDGRRWQVNPLRRQDHTTIPPTATAVESETSYRIIAEASQQRNLFALGVPLQSSNGVKVVSSGLVIADKAVSQRFSYSISSALQALPLQSSRERDINLQLAPGNPATKELALQLRQQYADTADLVNALAAFFNQQDFYYSLTPPALGRDSVDQFLFQTRSGFCSHYASATALLLRHAGVPARVVGGYLGGDWHQAQGYLAVRQREAHAWVEYYSQGYWQRFDPTAAVAPERILQSLDMALSDDERDMLTPFWQRSSVLQIISVQLMHLDYYWSVWVLGFDDTRQNNLWRSIRQHASLIAYVSAAAVVLLLLVVGLWLLQRRKTNQPLPAKALLLKALKPALTSKAPAQSVSACIHDLAKRHPSHSKMLQLLLQQYELAVFAEQHQAKLTLRQLLKQHKTSLIALNRAVKDT
ncbi:transglutaminase family protein [Rheinheimera gaetbuli]